MKDKDILALYETSPIEAIKLLKAMRMLLPNQRAGKSLLKNLKGISKKSGYPEGKPYCSRIKLAL